ncbi:unnamed protein product [Closterium sp. Naga37s-1]|nr:unnamed protein product [Closterium sp. Naga37s-1]
MTSDDAAACPVPAIDWRFVSREEIARLAQQGLVATAADSADRRSICDDSNLRRRRLRRVAREASAELARVVAEWRNEDFRRRDPQAVAVLAAERHRRSLSCSDLGGIRCGAEDEREDGLSWATPGRGKPERAAAGVVPVSTNGLAPCGDRRQSYLLQPSL